MARANGAGEGELRGLLEAGRPPGIATEHVVVVLWFEVAVLCSELLLYIVLVGAGGGGGGVQAVRGRGALLYEVKKSVTNKQKVLLRVSLNLSIYMDLYFSDILLYLNVVLITCCQAWSESQL